MISMIISFFIQDRYRQLKEKQRNELYISQSPFLSRVLH
ncbi:hypothetical protein N288_08545 [Bacillus infantis NRRL B-14911]|uniref:Sporulation protein n=1 Tax=Bacillus infantis NRRL B-14911 TaxID=1367477 RepID=U5LAI4_9BACI|nr:hypothetical protein N288_08545 [Bacillus infantis NRRL B-14911]